MQDIQAFYNGDVYSSSGATINKNGIFFAVVNSFFLRINHSDLLSRLLRKKIHQVIPYDEGVVVVIKYKFIFFDSNGLLKGELEIKRGSRPLKQGVVILNGFLYYGDYWPNKESLPARLYKVNLATLESTVLVEFFHVRHIHAVHQDKTSADALLVCTGDLDSESGIYQVNTFTAKIDVIHEGSQNCRAVSLLQIGRDLIWGSDSPDQINAIFRLNRDLPQQLTKLIDIAGPAYYSTQLASGELLISTGVEDKSRHKAIIYCSLDGGLTWSVNRSFAKDIWSPKYFGYGLIEFPYGQSERRTLTYNLTGLRQ